MFRLFGLLFVALGALTALRPKEMTSYRIRRRIGGDVDGEIEPTPTRLLFTRVIGVVMALMGLFFAVGGFGPLTPRWDDAAMTDHPPVRLRAYDGERDAVWAVHDRAFCASPVEFDPELDRHLRDIERTFRDPAAFLVGVVDVPPDPDGRGPEGERVVAVGGVLPATADAASVRSSPVDADPGTAELRSLRVDPAFQGRGYGRRLVRALERRARAAGFERVVLDTNVRLTAARGLYESLGYEEAGRESLDGVALVYHERSP